MNVSELVAELEQVKEAFGDVSVFVDGTGKPPKVIVEQEVTGVGFDQVKRFFKVVDIRADWS